MAQGPLVHYEKKQRLRATTVNALVDAAFDAKIALSALSMEKKLSLWPIPFRNVHPTQCPAFGVAEMTAPEIIGSELGVDVTQVGAVGGAQPELRRQYFVNGPQAINPSDTGYGCLLETANWVKYDGTASGFFSEWGVKPGSWAVWPDRYGFHPCGAATTMFGKVMLARQSVITAVMGLPLSFFGYAGSNKVAVHGGVTGASSLGLYVSNVLNVARDFPTGEMVRVDWLTGYPFGTAFSTQITLVVKAVTPLSIGQTGQCEVFLNGLTTNTQVTAQALGAKVPATPKWSVAWQESQSGQWYVGPWQC